MLTVSVSELKARLSHYLREVRRGGEVQVVDRGVPVAKLVRMEAVEGGDAERWDRLVRSGVLRAGTGDASPLLHTPPLSLEGSDLGPALQDDRDDRL